MCKEITRGGGGAADRSPHSSDYFRVSFLDPNDLSSWTEATCAVLEALWLGVRRGSRGRVGCLLLRQLQRAYTCQEVKVTLLLQGTSLNMLDSVLAHDPWDHMNDTQMAFAFFQSL